MKSIKEKEWCIALENIGPYIDPILGERYKFLKGERATKEKVFSMIPDITEEKYAELFRPATEEEINGEFEWNGLQYILKKPKRMTKEEVSSVLGHEPLTFEQMKEMEQMYLQYEWEKVRHQAAIAAMHGLISSKSYTHELAVKAQKESEPEEAFVTAICTDAVQMADALIKELQKNGKEKET